MERSILGNPRMLEAHVLAPPGDLWTAHGDGCERVARLSGMTSMSRGAKVAIVAVGVLGLGLALTLLIALELERRATIEVELQLAEPFLEIDHEARLERHYGSPFPDGLGSGLGAVDVIYRTDDPNAVVDQIHAVMRDQGWDRTRTDGTEWHSGGGDLGHRWGHIFIEDDEVRLFIGVIEG